MCCAPVVLIPFPFAFSFSFVAFVFAFLSFAFEGIVGVSSPRAGFLGHVRVLVQKVLGERVVCSCKHRSLFVVNSDIGEKLRERLESADEELNLHQRW